MTEQLNMDFKPSEPLKCIFYGIHADYMETYEHKFLVRVMRKQIPQKGHPLSILLALDDLAYEGEFKFRIETNHPKFEDLEKDRTS